MGGRIESQFFPFLKGGDLSSELSKATKIILYDVARDDQIWVNKHHLQKMGAEGCFLRQDKIMITIGRDFKRALAQGFDENLSIACVDVPTFKIQHAQGKIAQATFSVRGRKQAVTLCVISPTHK